MINKASFRKQVFAYVKIDKALTKLSARLPVKPAPKEFQKGYLSRFREFCAHRFSRVYSYFYLRYPSLFPANPNYMPQYGEHTYWNGRYKEQPNNFDWYQGYAPLKSIFNQYLPKKGHLLQVGVGTSKVQVDMAQDGYELITNTDYSEVAIESMKTQCPESLQSRLVYHVLDCRNMNQYGTGTFDGVFDKGTLDAILCGDESYGNAERLLRECHRVLKPDCYLVIVTYGDPKSRMIHLDIPGAQFDVKYYTLTKVLQSANANPHDYKEGEKGNVKQLGPFTDPEAVSEEEEVRSSSVHFVYVCKKVEKDDEENDNMQANAEINNTGLS